MADPIRYNFLNESVDVNPDTDQVIRRYTPTPTATVPTPTTPAAPAPTASNYPTLLTSEQFAAERTGSVDENAIRENIRKQMQDQVDAINVNFDNMVNEQNVLNRDSLGRTRAINARSGLMGSDFGAANIGNQENANSAAIKAINEERGLHLAKVNSRINQVAKEEIAAKKAEALGNATAYSAYLEKAQNEARSHMETLAKAGAKLEALGPNRAKLFKLAGYDEALGELVYNSLMPKASKIDFKAEKAADGKILLYGVDPTTGQLKTQRINFDVPDGYAPTYVDGQLYYKNATTGDLIPSPMDQSLYTNDYKNYLLSKKEGFSGNFEQWQTTDANRKRSVTNINYGGLSKEEFARVNALSDDVRQDPDIKDFVAIRDGYERVQTGANMNNAQGDLALLFGYMKILDPTSVVRETEFANAQAAMGYAQRILNIPAQFLRGERLTAEGRQNFATAAKGLYQRKQASYQKAADYYKERATQAGVDPNMVIRDFTSTVGGENDQVAELQAAGYSEEQIQQIINTK